CFELFVRPALRRLLGLAAPLPPVWQAALEADFAYKTDRPTYHPARLQWEGAQYRVRFVPWFGSADLRALSAANAFALITEGNHDFKSGQLLDVLPMDYY